MVGLCRAWCGNKYDNIAQLLVSTYKCLQDGATSHTTESNLAYLRRQFNDRVMSNKAAAWGQDWAARSPDMNPLDFGIWGILKQRVFAIRPRTMVELRNKINQEVNRLSMEPELLRLNSILC